MKKINIVTEVFGDIQEDLSKTVNTMCSNVNQTYKGPRIKHTRVDGAQ